MDECIAKVEVFGYKGKSGSELVSRGTDSEGDYFILQQWRKDKESKENYGNPQKVYLKEVELLWSLLSKNFDVMREHGCHHIWRLIVRELNLAEKEGASEDFLVTHFLGFRQKDTNYYFRYYMHPLLVLVSDQIRVAYLSGRGKITIFTKDDLNTILIKRGMK